MYLCHVQDLNVRNGPKMPNALLLEVDVLRVHNGKERCAAQNDNKNYLAVLVLSALLSLLYSATHETPKPFTSGFGTWDPSPVSRRRTVLRRACLQFRWSYLTSRSYIRGKRVLIRFRFLRTRSVQFSSPSTHRRSIRNKLIASPLNGHVDTWPCYPRISNMLVSCFSAESIAEMKTTIAVVLPRPAEPRMWTQTRNTNNTNYLQDIREKRTLETVLNLSFSCLFFSKR